VTLALHHPITTTVNTTMNVFLLVTKREQKTPSGIVPSTCLVNVTKSILAILIAKLKGLVLPVIRSSKNFTRTVKTAVWRVIRQALNHLVTSELIQTRKLHISMHTNFLFVNSVDFNFVLLRVIHCKTASPAIVS
jgi:hypothetical protein